MKNKWKILKYCILSIVIIFYNNTLMFAEETDTIPITASTDGWTKLSESTEDHKALATNYVTINGDDYKIEMGIYNSGGLALLNECNTITNMTTNEKVVYTNQSEETPTSVLLYALDGFTAYSALHSNGEEIYYKVETENGKEVLKKMILNTIAEIDVLITSKVTNEGKIVHTIEVTNTSNAVLKGFSLLAEVDSFINDEEVKKVCSDGNNGVYIADNNTQMFIEPLLGSINTYVGEYNVINLNDYMEGNNIELVTNKIIGEETLQYNNYTIYFSNNPQDINPGETLSLSYQEKIFIGDIKNSVIVKYLDEEDRVISDIEVINGTYGDTYKTSEKNFLGYEFLSVEEEENRIFTDIEKVIIYRYKKVSDTINNEATNTADNNSITMYFVLGITALLGSFLIFKRNHHSK
ncbi:MAG: MucBP domain-containing protein [Coprobacillaceae bacterium]